MGKYCGPTVPLFIGVATKHVKKIAISFVCVLYSTLICICIPRTENAPERKCDMSRQIFGNIFGGLERPFTPHAFKNCPVQLYFFSYKSSRQKDVTENPVMTCVILNPFLQLFWAQFQTGHQEKICTVLESLEMIVWSWSPVGDMLF